MKHLISPSARCILGLASILTLTGLVRAQDSGNVYGVVEIGASGIKATVIKLEADSDPENPPVKLLKNYPTLDVNAAFADSSDPDRIKKGVSQRHSEMIADFHFPEDHFYLVGSSGLPPKVKSIVAAVTFAEGQIEYITPDQESSLVFRGIVPARRHMQVVVLDIGSGNSKGAYIERLGPKPEFASFSLPLGTKTFAEEISKTRGDRSYAEAASAAAAATLLPQVHAQIRDLTGLQQRKRVYLAGGTPWVFATVMHPEEVGPDANGVERSWVRVTYEDIRTYYRKVIADPEHALEVNLHNVPEAKKKLVEDEFAKISKVFNQDQLVSGATILKTFADEMHLESKEAIFFSRRALYAWPQGYVMDKIGANATAVAAAAVPATTGKPAPAKDSAPVKRKKK